MEQKEISRRISMLREKKKISAREMSLAIGQNPNYINHIENNKTTPSLTGLYYICEYLGITLSEFFDFDNKNPTKTKAITDSLKKLNDNQLEIIEKVINEMTKK